MANNQAQLGVLRSTETTPIAQLHPEIPDPKSRVVDGVITITWPYSIVTKSIAFILAEHDVRLRRDKGQLRVEFHGPAGKALADSGVGGGDEIRLSLDGAQWEENKAQMKQPGTTLGWQMRFANRLLASVRRAESRESDTIDIDSPAEETRDSPEPVRAMSESPTVKPEKPNYATPLPQTPHSAVPAKRLASSVLEPGEYSSPAFLKRARVSYGSLFEGGFDIFNEDEVLKKKKRRKSRFSMGATAWRYTSRSPSPLAEQQSDDDDEPSKEPVNAVENGEATEQPMATPLRPTMVDEGCQTQELDFSPFTGVQVGAESRPEVMLLQSSPTPGWKHRNLAGELHEPPTLSFHDAMGHEQSPQHALEAIHTHETALSHALGFGLPGLPMDIDPRLQFHTANTTVDEPEHVLIPPEIQPQDSGFYDTQAGEGLAWATETSTATYTLKPARNFDGHNVEMIVSSSPVTRLGTEGEEEDVLSEEHGSRVHDRAREEIESISSDESGCEIDGVIYPEGHYRADHEDNERVTLETRKPSYQQEEPSDESEEEDGHWGSRMQEYDGSEEEYDEEDEEEDYRQYAANEWEGYDDVGDETEDDDDDDDDDDDKPVPRPLPQAPKEPIFISLLSDTEDEDQDTKIDDRNKVENKATGIHRVEDEGDESSEEDESEDENEAEESLEIKAEAYSSSERLSEPSQLDGCCDDVPFEHAAEKDTRNGAEVTARPGRVGFMSNDPARQMLGQAAEGTAETNPESPFRDDTAHARREVGRGEPGSSVQKGSDVVGRLNNVSDNGLANMHIHDISRPTSPDSPDHANVDEPAVSEHDVSVTQVRAENANSLEAVETIDLTIESSSSISNNLPMEMDVDDVDIPAQEDQDDHAEVAFKSQLSHPEERASPETSQHHTEKMDEDIVMHQDVEVKYAVVEQSTDEQDMPQEEDRGRSDQDSAAVLSKVSEVASPPETQSELQLSQDAEDDLAAEQQLMAELREHCPSSPAEAEDAWPDNAGSVFIRPEPSERESSPAEAEDVRPDSAASVSLQPEPSERASSPAGTEPEDVRPDSAASVPIQRRSSECAHHETPHREYVHEPEMLITVNSLRSYCRSHQRSISIDSTNDGSVDPSILLARTSPTRTQHCLVKDISPPPTLRVMRRKPSSQADPSIALAKAYGAPSEPGPAKESTPSGMLRVMRSRNNSADPSILLAQQSPGPSEASRQKATSPLAVILRAACRRADQPDANIQLATATPKSTRKQAVPGGSQRSSTHESAVAGEAPKSPSVVSSALEDATASALKLQLLKDLRTGLPDYLPLRSLRTSLNKTTDILAVATTTPSQPHRPKHGPRDYMLELTLTDPSAAPTSISVAHIFRPHQASLPVVHAGDVVLLRRVQVVSMQGRGFGVRAGDVSAWAVFEKGDEEMLPQIKGPPVEIGDEEVEYAQGLRRWWSVLDGQALAKIDKASLKVSSSQTL